MSSIHYSAAWTECGCLITCWHEHKAVREAAACIRRAGVYVVAIENSVMRCLRAEEEDEFQHAIGEPRTELDSIVSRIAFDDLSSVNTTFPWLGDFILNWLDKWEIKELERMHNEQLPFQGAPEPLQPIGYAPRLEV